MNEKITLPTIVQLLAIATGDTRKESEDFVKEFFALISSLLAEGESVKIKDFGVFKTINVDERKSINVSTGSEQIIPAHRKVVFVPAKEIASLVNSPFEMFETVELEEGVEFNAGADDSVLVEVEEEFSASESEEDLTAQDAVESLANENASEEESPLEKESPTDEVPKDEVPQEETPQVQNRNPEIEVEAAQEDNSVVEETFNVYTAPEEDVEEQQEVAEEVLSELPARQRRRFWPGFMFGFVSAAVLAMLAALVLVNTEVISLNYRNQVATVVPQPAPADSCAIVQNEPLQDSAVASTELAATGVDATDEYRQRETPAEKQEVPTKPSDEPIYDTITTTRYLTTMAKDHYGNFNLWPYIYMENQSFLGHPDRIRPGTKVVVPPLSKYGIDPNNPADIAKAKRKGVEIYKKYNK